jgi:flagellar motor switch protein FliN/FliY
MDIQSLLNLSVGSIQALDRPCGEPIDVRVNGKTIAKAEVVVIDDSFGFRVTQVLGETEA